MAINLNIKHNNTLITDLQTGSIELNTANKLCEDNLIFTLSGVEEFLADFLSYITTEECETYGITWEEIV